MYDKSKRRKRRHNTRRCKRKLKKMYNNGYRSKMSSYCKKLTNRKVRRYKGEIHKGGNYRRVFDMWWELD